MLQWRNIFRFRCRSNAGIYCLLLWKKSPSCHLTEVCSREDSYATQKWSYLLCQTFVERAQGKCHEGFTFEKRSYSYVLQ